MMTSRPTLVSRTVGVIKRVAVVLAPLTLLVATFPASLNAAAPPSALGQSYAVSTDHADATRAALEVMAGGGNAVDGAIAAALALGVVNPAASGIGGGGFALVYTAKDRKVTAFDFRETAPARFSSEILWAASSSGRSRWDFNGVSGAVVGVPGEPAGLEVLSRRFARRSLADDAAPAVALARNGFYVNAQVAGVVATNKDRVAASASLATAFLPGGVPVPFATRVRRPDLAATLARYGAEGKRSIYEGRTAQRIAAAVQATGGTMTEQDLAAYEVKEREPLVRTYDGRTFYTMPAPSAGGLTLLEVLGMYGAAPSSPLAAMGHGSSAYIHVIAEALRGGFADRVRNASDPDIDPNVAAAYRAALEPAQLAARRARIDPQKTHAPTEFRTKETGTSHLSIADAEGNVVALTTTINNSFGASLVPDGTGILLNNELEDFTPVAEIREFALADGGPNRPRPRARPVSSMTPTIVFENGEPILAVGGSGGPRIATGVTQAALERLVFGHDPSACVSSPRFHTQGITLLVDPEIPADVRDGLRGRGETVAEEPIAASAIQMIAWSRTPGQPTRILAASDPRKAGLSAAR